VNPTAERIYDFVLDHILAGKVAQNDLLPKEVDLAARFGVSRMNAHAAMKELERHGIVRRKRRVGTVVNRVPSLSLATHLKGLTAKRVHIIAGMEMVPLHWSAATLGELDSLLGREGYRVTHVPIPETLSREAIEEILRNIAAEGSFALLMILPGGVSRVFQRHVDLILRYHRNVYLFDRGDTPPEGWPINVVSLDPFSEGVAAAEYLYQCGYRRLAFWLDLDNKYWAQQRLAGLKLGLERASGGSVTPTIFDLPLNRDFSPVLRWLQEAGEPSAVAAANDEHAAALIDLAARQGLHPPDDYAVIGFDNNPRYRSCNLTTVAPPLHRVAAIMAQVLSGQAISAEEFSSVVLRLPSQIIERNTCSQLSPAAGGVA
jgi:LacI family transcriptional regulator